MLYVKVALWTSVKNVSFRLFFLGLTGQLSLSIPTIPITPTTQTRVSGGKISMEMLTFEITTAYVLEVILYPPANGD